MPISVLICWTLVLRITGNVHPVGAGLAYRSAQPSAADLAAYQKRYRIRSVLSLRRKNLEHCWCREELAACRDLGLTHLNFALSASQPVSPEILEKLANTLKRAPRPLLIHCKSGSDRAALASAMWRVVVEKEDPRRAKEEFSIRYGHIPFGRSSALSASFDRWIAWRAARN